MAAQQREWNLSAKVYVGNLGELSADRQTLEEVFARYGPVSQIWQSPTEQPGYAFVEFVDDSFAEAASRALDTSVDTTTSRGKVMGAPTARFTPANSGGNGGDSWRGIKKQYRESTSSRDDGGPHHGRGSERAHNSHLRR